MWPNEEIKSLEFDIPKENCQLEYFELSSEEFSGEDTFHYLFCNRGGRKIKIIAYPLTLWPLVLQRADTIKYYDKEDDNTAR